MAADAQEQLAIIRDARRALYTHLTVPPITDKDDVDVKVFGQQSNASTPAYGDPDDPDAPAPGEPIIKIKQLSTPSPSDTIGAANAKVFVPQGDDGNGNPTSYDEVLTGTAHDIEFDIRYTTFDEDDDAIIAGQLSARLKRGGFSLSGPADKGPFLFDLILSRPISGNPNEFKGLYRVETRDVWLGRELIGAGTTPPITSTEVEMDPVTEIS